eukprot:346785_1
MAKGGRRAAKKGRSRKSSRSTSNPAKKRKISARSDKLKKASKKKNSKPRPQKVDNCLPKNRKKRTLKHRNKRHYRRITKIVINAARTGKTEKLQETIDFETQKLSVNHETLPPHMRTIWHRTKWRLSKLHGDPPLHLAYKKGHENVVKMLVLNGFDVQPKDTEGNQLLDLYKARDLSPNWLISRHRTDLDKTLRGLCCKSLTLSGDAIGIIIDYAFRDPTRHIPDSDTSNDAANRTLLDEMIANFLLNNDLPPMPHM